MKRLKRYFLEIKKNVDDGSSENGNSQNIFNIILICNDAINYIAKNPYDKRFTALLKGFGEMKMLAENAVSEGQQKPRDSKHARIERIKEIIDSMAKVFEPEAVQKPSQSPSQGNFPVV